MIAIDPGENTGGAFFVNGALVWAGLLSLLDGTHSNTTADKLIIEIPFIRPDDITGGRGARANNPAAVAAKRINDLLSVCVCAGQWIRSINAPHTRRVRPHEWKGGVPKEIHNARVLEKLSSAESLLLPKLPASKLHNVVDAVGLGLFELGRMGRGA